MSLTSQEVANPHIYMEELDPGLLYERTVNPEPVNTIQDEGVKDNLELTNYARRLGAVALVTLAALVPADSAFAASSHEAPHHRAARAELTRHETGKHTHHKKQHHGHANAPTQASELARAQPPVPVPSLAELFQFAYADANATWGISQPPCGGNVTYQSEPNNFDTTQSWIMESSWHDIYTRPDGATTDAVNVEGPQVDPQNFSGCTMYYNNQLQPNASTSDMANNWTYFCTAVSHEWQHFLNQYSHETPTDHGQAVEPPTSISYPSWTMENTPDSCISNAPPGVTMVTLTSENAWSITPPGGNDVIFKIPPGIGPLILAP
jgi:hypothetical protein